MEITVDGTKLNYEVHGIGQPIYFLHGMGADLKSMTATYEPLFQNKYYQRIYLDLPGMGDSQDIDKINGSDDVLNLVAEAISQLTGKQKVSLVGHSYGGYLCLGLVAKFSDKIKNTFVTCPVVVSKKERRNLNFHKSILEEDVNITNNSEYYAEYFKTNVVINQTTWERYQLTRISGIKKFNKKFWDDIKATGKYNLSINLPVALAENVNSIMMLVGKNDNIVGFEDQLNILNKQNKVEVAVIEDAGHNICMDQPDYFNFYFNKFLQSIG